MDEKNRQQLINLYGFVNLFLSRALRRAEYWAKNIENDKAEEKELDLSTSLDKARLRQMRFGGSFHLSELARWEIYLWLDLGVSLRYFPKVEAEALLHSASASFPEYYSTYPAVGDLLPGRLHLSLRRAFGVKPPKYFVDLNYGDFIDPNRVHSLFSTLLLLQSALSANGMTESTISALTFDNTDLWRSYMNDEIEMDRLNKAFTYRPGEKGVVSKETLICGFVRILEYLGNQKQLRGQSNVQLQRDPVVDGDIRILLHWAKEICFWRVNILRREYRDRFWELALITSDLLTSKFVHESIPNLREASRATYRNLITELLTFWSDEVEMDLSSGTSA